MNFNEFLTHAKKVNGMPLDTLAKEVGAHGSPLASTRRLEDECTG